MGNCRIHATELSPNEHTLCYYFIEPLFTGMIAKSILLRYLLITAVTELIT